MMRNAEPSELCRGLARFALSFLSQRDGGVDCRRVARANVTRQRATPATTRLLCRAGGAAGKAAPATKKCSADCPINPRLFVVMAVEFN